MVDQLVLHITRGVMKEEAEMAAAAAATTPLDLAKAAAVPLPYAIEYYLIDSLKQVTTKVSPWRSCILVVLRLSALDVI